MKRLRVKSVRYGRTFNLGNYESARLDMEAEVGPKENVDLVLCALKEEVLAQACRLRGHCVGACAHRCGK